MTSAQRPTLHQSVALVWRTLRSMRTALILLLMIGLASVAGSLLPQWPNSPERVIEYRAEHAFWGTFFDRAGLFDVFGSWWFVLLTTLLFVSLIACLVPRTRALLRALRTPPMQAREIDAFPCYTDMAVAAAPDAALGATSRTLRRRRFRVARDPERPALAAEKGVAREVGSLAFHWAFILLLAGVLYGKGTGFSGFAVVVEGQTWIDAQANYDGQIRTGRFFDGDFTGAGVRLRDFRSDFRRTGQPMDFVSEVDLLGPDGSVLGPADIRVNHPASIEGIRIYQIDFGWAPTIEIRDRGEVVASGPVVMDRDPAPEGVVDFAMPWRGIVKQPGAGAAGADRAIELELWPDSRGLAALLQGDEPQAMLVEFDPDHQVHGVGRHAHRPLDEPARHDAPGRGLHGDPRRRAHGRSRRREGAHRGRDSLGPRDLVPGAPPVLGVPGEPRRRGAPGAGRGYPHPRGIAARAVRLPAEGLGPDRPRR